MRAPCSYDYAVIRVVPRVERQEFLNAGVVVWCQEQDLLQARVDLDESRLRALHADVDVDTVRRHLDSFVIICEGGPDSGPIGQLSKRERFDWLVAPRSTIIQCSAVHSGRCIDAADTIGTLLRKMVG
ncbi:MAG: hypothetical protein K0Q92_1561 [Steroidobacteraceae bacterium]|nr:hypothetical protein [Steroidobacteraceae bacterium]